MGVQLLTGALYSTDPENPHIFFFIKKTNNEQFKQWKWQTFSHIGFNLPFIKWVYDISGPWVSLWCLICGFFRLLCEALIFPLQERLDDWKKSVIQVDKDHAKGIKMENCLGSRCWPSGWKALLNLKTTMCPCTRCKFKQKFCYLYATNIICCSCCSMSSYERKKWNKSSYTIILLKQ